MADGRLRQAELRLAARAQQVLSVSCREIAQRQLLGDCRTAPAEVGAGRGGLSV